MAVDYMVYLKRKEGSVAHLDEYVSTSLSMAAYSTREQIEASLWRHFGYLKNEYEFAAHELYVSYARAQEDRTVWRTVNPGEFNRLRTQFLLKSTAARDHPVQKLAHIDEVFFVEDDPHADLLRPSTLFSDRNEAIAYLALVKPEMTMEQRIEKIKGVKVYTFAEA